MPVESGKATAEKKVQEFTENLKRRLRNLHPRDYLPFAASRLRRVIENRETWRRYPPHFILHSMEANCAFHRRGLHSEIRDKTFQRIVNVYKDFNDPAPIHTLDQGKSTDLDLFMLAQARQQFVVQDRWGRYDLASAILMFLAGSFGKTEPQFRTKFGLSFAEWIKVCTLVYIASIENDVVVAQSSVQDRQEIVSDNVVEIGFSLLSRSIDELSHDYGKLRSESSSPLLESQLPYLLAEKPLVHIEKDLYVVTHAPFLLSRAAQGIYDLCHAHFKNSFGKELGSAFQHYVCLLLNELPGDKTILSEAELGQFIQGQVCDYLLAMEDIVILVECKATSYSSNYVTENAVRKANSTTKIVDGFHQLSNVAKQLHHPQMTARIGDAAQRMVIGVIVTYRDIRFTDSPLYRSIIDPQVDIPEAFTWRPQVIDSRALQMLIQCACGGRSLSSIFREKLDSEPHTRHAWDVYLNEVFRGQQAEERDSTIPLLEETWRTFSQDAGEGESEIE